MTKKVEKKKPIGRPPTSRWKIEKAIEDGSLQLMLQTGKSIDFIQKTIGVGKEQWSEYRYKISGFNDLLEKYKKNRMVFGIECLEECINGKTIELKTIDPDGNVTVKEVFVPPNPALVKWYLSNISRLMKAERWLNDTETESTIKEVALKEEEAKQKNEALSTGTGDTKSIFDWLKHKNKERNIDV